MRSRLARYRHCVVATIVFVVAYPIIAGASLVVLKDESVTEIFPFAAWALFCFVPNEESDFTIELKSLDGDKLSTPLVVESIKDLCEREKMVAYDLIQSLAAEIDHPVEFDLLRSRLEQDVLIKIAEQGQYRLTKRRFDVMKRWRKHEFQSSETVFEGQFSCN